MLAALLAPGGASPGGTPPSGSILQLEVTLPEGWQQGTRVVLLLEDVTTPRGQAFIARAFATAAGEPDAPLGRFGVMAEKLGAPGMRPPVTYRMDVTQGLRRWAERHPMAKSLHITLATAGPGSKPLVVAWRVGRARFVVRS
jgi:hypothetical protein